MSHKKRKPLLYILKTESGSLQKTVSSAIENAVILNEDNQLTRGSKKSDIFNTLVSATLETIINPMPLSFELMALLTKMKPYEEKKADNKTPSKDSKIDSINNQENNDSILQENNDSILDISKEIKSLGLESLAAFVDQIHYSSIPEDFEFSPGHPLPGRFYRAHPLKSKSNKYIPIETFDSLLYAERESELIRLLVDLGATKIRIQENQSGTIESGATTNVEITGVGGIETELKGNINKSNKAIREFSLEGMNWTLELKKKIEENEYSWLPYEPAWSAVVHARLYGKCSTASIELTNDNSYSTSGKIGAKEGILQFFTGFDAGASFTRSQNKTSLISAEFAPSISTQKVDSTEE
ncbi:hypothetical protein [Planktothrix agardhii]|jgi:hypothetical protein|uniref:Uncharacterized protein n=1 Tax=Planktothrix agardhii TaxID=1160 RepID=A0AAD1Q6F4_PLAAG|nr:hypothetical protein [Planktothrix agardhii]MCB8789044.1 hypothetical protein [Planktothrix agardhii 1025]MCF3614174.1 hypothetical protein [Planktothrix agardhii 1027]CAD5984727.1 hypothetical protein PANO66_04474 [Planktothrix agardhii]